MEKIDYKKKLKHLYNPPSKKVEFVDVPQMNFLMIDGEGDPNTSQSFASAIEALYPLAYTLKFMVKTPREPLFLFCLHSVHLGHLILKIPLWYLPLEFLILQFFQVLE